MITNLKPRTYPKGQSIEIIKSNFYLENYKLSQIIMIKNMLPLIYIEKSKIKLSLLYQKNI